MNIRRILMMIPLITVRPIIARIGEKSMGPPRPNLESSDLQGARIGSVICMVMEYSLYRLP